MSFFSKLFRRRKHGKIPGDVAIIGGGSWATAIAKMILEDKDERIWWYFHQQDTIDEFKSQGHNPSYLIDVPFNVEQIDFTSDINEAVEKAGILILVTPSPYLKSLLNDIRVSLKDKFVVIATKGLVPDDNAVWSDYLHDNYEIPEAQIAVVSGPSHAEEVAQSHLTYLTVGCTDKVRGAAFAKIIENNYVRTTLSTDLLGIEYAGVLKNVYALCAGICTGLKYGENFQAVLIANAAREMTVILKTLSPTRRGICDSVYMGDLLVTGYSKFSRNRTFGTMLGRGYSVRAAQSEMQMIAEGYYAAKCMHEICAENHIEAPILEVVYNVIYENMSPREAIEKLSQTLR